MQKLILMSMLLISITAAAQQTQTDSVVAATLQADSLYKHSGNSGYRQVIDTTGKTKLMQDYGMRIYDPRIGRYIPPDPNQSAIANPYAYLKKQPVKRGKKK